MKKSFRKGFLLGVGLARMTGEKAKAAGRKIEREVKSFARENRINKKEADALAKEFVKNFEVEKKKFVAVVRKETKSLEKEFRKRMARGRQGKRGKR